MTTFPRMIYCGVKLSKKRLLAVVLATGFCGTMASQNESFRLGVQLSPGFSWITTDDHRINRTGTNLGVTIGMIGEYFFSEQVALTGGLALAFSRGGTLRHDIGGNFFSESELSSDIYNAGDKPLPDGVRLKYKMQYLEVPMSLKFRTKEHGYFRYFAEAPIITWGVRLQARGTIDAGDLYTEKEDIAKDVNLLNLSWGFGLGAEYALSENNSLIGGLFFSRSFIDITNNSAQKAMDNPDQRPSDPDDDFIFTREDSKGLINSLTIRIAVLF